MYWPSDWLKLACTGFASVNITVLGLTNPDVSLKRMHQLYNVNLKRMHYLYDITEPTVS